MSELVFNGVTAYARIEEQKWSEPLLVIRPHKNQFTYVAIPGERLLSVEAISHEHFARWSIALHGEFSRTSDGTSRSAGPMADRDAQGMAAAIAARYHLPKRPVEVFPHAVATLPAHSLVIVVGTYENRHVDMANFEGIVVKGHAFEPGRRYRITGFTSPGAPPDAPPIPGWNGPTVTAVHVEPL